jgi:uncharacterized membrane protein YphA (DoxX/SURF4 family)
VCRVQSQRVKPDSANASQWTNSENEKQCLDSRALGGHPLRLIVGYGFIAHGLCQAMAMILLVAALTVHLPYRFSSIKLRAVTASGAQFGPPGYETDLLYLACLATLVLGGSGPFAVDGLLARLRGRRV